MSDTATPRYGYAPQVPFAATRACAGRSDRQTSVTAQDTVARQSRARRLLHRVIGR